MLYFGIILQRLQSQGYSKCKTQKVGISINKHVKKQKAIRYTQKKRPNSLLEFKALFKEAVTESQQNTAGAQRGKNTVPSPDWFKSETGLG